MRKDGSREGPIHKRVYATFESHAALFRWLAVEATKRGYGTKRTLFLADGAEAIWEQQAIHFPLAEPCIDWVHIVEKLWAAGRCLHPEGSASLAAWVNQRVRDLRRRSGADKVITALSDAYASIPKTGPGNKGKREKLLDVIERRVRPRLRVVPRRAGRARGANPSHATRGHRDPADELSGVTKESLEHRRANICFMSSANPARASRLAGSCGSPCSSRAAAARRRARRAVPRARRRGSSGTVDDHLIPHKSGPGGTA